VQNIDNKEHAQTVLHFFEELKNIENWGAWFLAELCKAEKGVQKRQEKLAPDRARLGVFSISPCLPACYHKLSKTF
jgi:hypothetical protein